MGNNCYANKRVDLPVRVVRIRQKDSAIAKNKLGEYPISYQSTGVTNLNKGAAEEVDESTPVSQNELSVKPIIPETIISKTLGIGEHYLETKDEEFETTEKPLPTFPKKSHTYSQKKEKELEDLIKKSLSGIEAFKVKQIADRYFTETEASLSNYYKEYPRELFNILTKGPPMKFRWPIWKVKANPEQYYVEDLYEKLRSLQSVWEKDIRKDVHRTFPEEPYFSNNQFGLIGQNQLSNVLIAISNYFPHVGYCQGMNFIVAFLLMVSGGNELESFWLFVTLARSSEYYLIGLFEDGFPLLNLYIFIFYQLFKKELPVLYEHFQSLMLPDNLWITNWFWTLFLYALPTKKVIRLWDLIITEDIFFMLKAAVALLKLYEKEILGLDTNGVNDLFRFIKTEKHIKNPKLSVDESTIIFMAKEVDIEQLLKIAQKIKLSKEKIAEFSKLSKEKKERPVSSEFADVLDFYAGYHQKYNDTNELAAFQQMIDLKIMKKALTEKIGGGAEGISSEEYVSKINLGMDQHGADSLILKDLDIIEEAEESEKQEESLEEHKRSSLVLETDENMEIYGNNYSHQEHQSEEKESPTEGEAGNEAIEKNFVPEGTKEHQKSQIDTPVRTNLQVQEIKEDDAEEEEKKEVKQSEDQKIGLTREKIPSYVESEFHSYTVEFVSKPQDKVILDHLHTQKDQVEDCTTVREIDGEELVPGLPKYLSRTSDDDEGIFIISPGKEHISYEEPQFGFPPKIIREMSEEFQISEQNLSKSPYSSQSNQNI